MNSVQLQRSIDELLETSSQQWRLRCLGVLAAVGALFAAAAANEAWWPFGLVVVTLLAIAAAIRPDSHTGLVAIVLIIGHWIATVDDVGTPWLPFAAVCTLAFHTVIAMLASIPTGGELPPATLRRWLGSGAIVSAATIAMWLLVVALDQRGAAGNGAVTGAAIAVAALLAVATRARSVDTNASA